jgi:hypothetical protein
MLKVILGSALGGLAAGAVALVASASTRNAPESPWPFTSAQPAGVVDAFGSRAATSEPALVECEPHQRAELRRVAVNGRDVVQVTCVTHGHLAQPAVLTAGSDIVAAPAVAPRPVARAVPVRQRVVTEEPVRRTSSGRSWGKSALVIGGGAGAGAGVGGLISGKKGALIGAAIGGGSAAIYEATKRR